MPKGFGNVLVLDPREIILLINYFMSDNPRRQKEIDFCVRANVESSHFSRIISIGKCEPKHPGVTHQHLFKRPNYRQFIEYCNKHHMGQICVLANIDITFDDTILLTYEVDLEKTMLALTRWGSPTKIAPNGQHAQDVWIFQPPFRIDTRLTDFTMGYLGCDNKIARIAVDAGYRVVNPSKSIKTMHHHRSGYRTYDKDSRFDESYLVHPCFIEEIL